MTAYLPDNTRYQMAPTMNRLVFLAVIFIVTLSGSESALRIVIDPQVWDGLADKLNITCIADMPASWDKTLLMMQVINPDKEDAPMVSINNLQRIHKGYLKDNMNATGFIDNDVSKASQSYLTLTMDKPSPRDARTYGCQMFYHNERNHIEDTKVTGGVTYNDCPDGWTPYNADETCMKAFGLSDRNEELSWSDSRKACQKLGGDLVQIRDWTKNNAVYRLILSSLYTDPWIGLQNVARVGLDFKYVDGSPLLRAFQPWRRREPSGRKATGEKCVSIISSPGWRGKWADNACSKASSYVCSTPLTGVHNNV